MNAWSRGVELGWAVHGLRYDNFFLLIGKGDCREEETAY